MSVVQKLVQAIEDGDEKLAIDLLRQKPDVNQTVDKYDVKPDSVPMRGISPLHLAVRKGMPNIVDRLLDYGYLADSVNKYDGKSSFHYAVVGGHMTIVDKLVSCGANINMADKQGDTPLHIAVMAQPMDAIETMLSLKCDVNRQNQGGDTPLHLASRCGFMDVIEILVSHRKSVNVVNKKGQTPLHVACSHENTEAVEALLHCGADLTTKDQKGQRPRDLVKSPRMKQMLRMAAVTSERLIRSQRITFNPRTTTLPLMIDRVKLAIESLTCSTEPERCSIYSSRELIEDSDFDIRLTDEEDLTSDVFVVSMANDNAMYNIVWSVPFFQCPAEREELVIKFANGQTETVGEWSKKDKELRCRVQTTLVDNCYVCFMLVLRHRREQFKVGTKAVLLKSEVDSDFAIDIPKGAFAEDTDLDLQVYRNSYSSGAGSGSGKPDKPEVETLSEGMSDIYQISVTKQPEKEIQLRVPFRGGRKTAGDIVIVTADEKTMENEEGLQSLDCSPVIKDSCLVFPVQHFSIYTWATRLLFSQERSKVYEHLERTVSKRVPVVFFAVASLLDDETFLIYVDCCPLNKRQKRLDRYIANGYNTMEPIESAPSKVRKGRTFSLDVCGEIALVDTDIRPTLKFSSILLRCRQKLFLRFREGHQGVSAEGAIIITQSSAKARRRKPKCSLPIRLQKTATTPQNTRPQASKKDKQDAFWMYLPKR